jgi:exoribonuclease II
MALDRIRQRSCYAALQAVDDGRPEMGLIAAQQWTCCLRKCCDIIAGVGTTPLLDLGQGTI